MSAQPLWLRDLLAYSLQAGALVFVAEVIARVLRLRVPRMRLAYWEALLAICLFLPLLQPWRVEVLDSSGIVMSNVTAAAPAATAASPAVSLAEIILLIICAGVVARAAWITLGLGRLWLYRRQAQRFDVLPRSVTEARSLTRVSPDLLVSSRLGTPATFGFFHPAVLFPPRILAMDPAKQRAIALHEFLHVERRDWLWNLLEEAVLTLLWFHLPLWWVVRNARLSREQAVDSEVVRRTDSRGAYLEALLEMAGQKPLSVPAPLFLHESQLAARVALIVKEVQMSRTRLVFSILAAAATLLLTGATLVWAFPLKTSVEATISSSPIPSGEDAGAADVAEETGSNRKKSRIYQVGDNVQAPTPIYMPGPPYTQQARKAHLSGTVVLSLLVDAKGRVAQVSESSEPLGGGLDESAIDTVRTWKFKPGMRKGAPVPVRVSIQITFHVDQDKNANGTSSKPKSASAAADPPAQSDTAGQSNPPANINQSDQPAKIDRSELRQQIRQALKQSVNKQAIELSIQQALDQGKLAQEMAGKINQDQIQHQVEQALKQAHLPQQISGEINGAEIERQIQEAMKQAELARKSIPKIDQAKIQQQFEQAMKQAKLAQKAIPKIDQAWIQKQIDESLKQAKIAEQATSKINEAEIERQVQQAMKQAEAARKAAEKARENLNKYRMQMKKEHEETRPSPASPPAPVPAAPKGLVHPPSPPQPPAAPNGTMRPPQPPAVPSPKTPAVPAAPGWSQH